MNKLILILIITTTLATTGGCTQDSTSFSREYIQAIRNGAKAKVTLNVTDEHGKPVTNAAATVYFDMISKQGNTLKGLTDMNGLFSAEALCADYASVVVNKESYYTTHFRYRDINSSDPGRLKDGRWQPWDPTIPVVLREIRNPIPMYVKRFDGKFVKGQDVGFDFEAGDYVAPHGNGKIADFTIRVEGGGIEFKRMIKSISIDSLDPDGGFMILEKYNYSHFKSEYLAPESGYVTNLTARSDRNFVTGETSSDPHGLYDVGSEYLIIKSRIIRDDKGDIISANYGKIYGDFEYVSAPDGVDGARAAFSYYFNPTPNDRNLEFNGKDPLFKAIDERKPPEWSREP